MTRRAGKGPLSLFFACALSMTFQIHCGQAQKATVEAVDEGNAVTLTFSLTALNGRRDGARVSAAVVFSGQQSGDRLALNLLLDLGPPIHLAAGNYQMKAGASTFAGRVEALSLDFEAGQSGGMSLGGRFLLLNSSGVPQYRVLLPPTLFDTTYR